MAKDYTDFIGRQNQADTIPLVRAAFAAVPDDDQIEIVIAWLQEDEILRDEVLAYFEDNPTPSD